MPRKPKAQEKDTEPVKNTEDDSPETENDEVEDKKTPKVPKKGKVEPKEEEDVEEKDESVPEEESQSTEDTSTVVSPPKTYSNPPTTQPTTIEKPPTPSAIDTVDTTVDSTLKFFVGGLHPNTDEAEMSTYFAKYGQILSAQVMRDLMTGRHRGFGFVTVKVQPNTMAVFKDTHVLSGKRVDVRAMQTDVQAALRKKIFVGGLSKALNEEMLEEYFSKFGEVEKVTIMRQLDGTSRGFGFIVFGSEHASEGALRNPTHFVYGNKVDVRAAETRQKTQSSNQSSYGYQYGMPQSHGDMYNSSMYRGQGGYDPSQYANMLQQYPQYQMMQQQMVQQQMAMAGSYGGGYGGYYGAAGQPGAGSNAPGVSPYSSGAYGPYRGKHDQGYAGSSHSNDPNMNPRNYRQSPY